jgi:hypothetical protein
MNTKQEIFDAAVKQIALQGGPSVALSGFCAYRGENGRKCAVGAVLADDEYEPIFEDHGSVNLINLPDRLKPHRRFLRELQQAHDGANRSSDKALDATWSAPHQVLGIAWKLKVVAGNHGLSIASLNAAFPVQP